MNILFYIGCTIHVTLFLYWVKDFIIMWNDKKWLRQPKPLPKILAEDIEVKEAFDRLVNTITEAKPVWKKIMRFIILNLILNGLCAYWNWSHL